MNWVSEDSKLLDTAASFLTASLREKDSDWIRSMQRPIQQQWQIQTFR